MNSANPKRSSIPARGDGTFDRLTEEAVEEIEAASSSGDPRSQSLMGFVYGTGANPSFTITLLLKDCPVVEPTRIHSGTEENKGALRKSRGEEDEDFSDIGVSSAERQCCGYVQDWTVLLLWSARVKALHWFSKAVEKGEPRILFPHLNAINIVSVGRLLCLWDSHNIKKNDEFMGISLLLLDEQQQLDLPSVSLLTLIFGGLSRVDTMEGRKKKSSYQLENLTRSLPTPVNRTFLPMKTEEADFLCKAQIVGVVQQNGLSFVSCTGCNMKLAKSLWCNRCVSPNAPGSSAVDDGKESATFVVFDREMIKLIKKEAKSGSCVDTLVAVGGMELPKCLEELAGNGYLSSYSGNSNKAPVMDLKSGQPTAFASSAGDAAKIALGNDGANQPGSAYCSQRQNPQTPT
uniref:Replication factor A C-terminal domain-containing protein n=1 Tax=Brassica oleracea var. oleracea TaxID=109376 RepID=A0A0D3AXC8_BRAOL